YRSNRVIRAGAEARVHVRRAEIVGNQSRGVRDDGLTGGLLVDERPARDGDRAPRAEAIEDDRGGREHAAADRARTQLSHLADAARDRMLVAVRARTHVEDGTEALVDRVA